MRKATRSFRFHFTCRVCAGVGTLPVPARQKRTTVRLLNGNTGAKPEPLHLWFRGRTNTPICGRLSSFSDRAVSSSRPVCQAISIELKNRTEGVLVGDEKRSGSSRLVGA